MTTFFALGPWTIALMLAAAVAAYVLRSRKARRAAAPAAEPKAQPYTVLPPPERIEGTMAGDLYQHHHLNLTAEQETNLLHLARHLIGAAAEIEASGGLSFPSTPLADQSPSPEAARTSTVTLPPLAHGPRSGLAPEPGEDWPAYCAAVFGATEGSPLLAWLQSPGWSTTEPSPLGAGLRIAYVLDFGVPYDHAEIAAGRAETDYDDSGFLWDRLAMPPTNLTDEGYRRLADWPRTRPRG